MSSRDSAALPEPWKRKTSHAVWPGKTFFYNTATKETTWDYAVVQQQAAEHKKQRDNGNAECIVIDHQWRARLSKHRAPGRYFYHNIATKQCTWNYRVVLLSGITSPRTDEVMNVLVEPEEVRAPHAIGGQAGSLARVFEIVLRWIRIPDTLPPTAHELLRPFRASTFPCVQDFASIFDLKSNTEASIGVESFMLRIFSAMPLSPVVFHVSIIYILRAALGGGLQLSHFNQHKLIAASMVLAAKFFEDKRFSVSNYSFVCGIDGDETKELEGALLQLLQWRLYVSNAELQSFQELVDVVMHQGGQKGLVSLLL